MKLIAIIIVFITTRAISIAQIEVASPELLDSLYINAISTQHLFLVNGTIYVEINENIDRIKESEELNYLKFLSTHELIEESLKLKKTISAIRVVHKPISKDTIDINIGHLKIAAKRGIFFKEGIRFRKADIKLDCNGTDGYQPTCRFVFNQIANHWELMQNN
jgi:hypothetical protein